MKNTKEKIVRYIGILLIAVLCCESTFIDVFSEILKSYKIYHSAGKNLFPFINRLQKLQSNCYN